MHSFYVLKLISNYFAGNKRSWWECSVRLTPLLKKTATNQITLHLLNQWGPHTHSMTWSIKVQRSVIYHKSGSPVYLWVICNIKFYFLLAIYVRNLIDPYAHIHVSILDLTLHNLKWILFLITLDLEIRKSSLHNPHANVPIIPLPKKKMQLTPKKIDNTLQLPGKSILSYNVSVWSFFSPNA